jgi:hypothetical protein
MTLYEFLAVFSLDTKVKLYNASWVVIYEGPIKRMPAEYILESYYVLKSRIDDYSTLEVAIELRGDVKNGG